MEIEELSWDTAKDWQEEANEGKREEEPRWGWDCNFKLDFDGELMSCESRFYPPSYNKHDGWEGSLRITLFGEEYLEQEIKAPTLDDLKTKVEETLEKLKRVIVEKLKN